MFFKTTLGDIAGILILFQLFIFIQGPNCIQLFRRYKQALMAEMKEEREKLETERVKSQKKTVDLKTLKAWLADRKTDNENEEMSMTKNESDGTRRGLKCCLLPEYWFCC